MLNLDESLILARTHKQQINHCTEYTNAYAFSYEIEGRQIGGDSPVVIMKETGKALNLISYATMPGKEYVRDFAIT